MAENAFAQTLAPAQIRNVKPRPKPFKLFDGGGLFLLVQPNGAKHWRYKYRLASRENLLALGAFPEVGLAEARARHAEARRLVAAGIHPAEHKRQQEREQVQARAREQTGNLAAVARQWLDTTGPELAESSRRQRQRELDTDVLPKLGSRQVANITRAELAEVLKSVEIRAPAVARNIRQALAGIFDHAIDIGLISGSPVPTSKVLRRRAQVPHQALSLARWGEFVAALEASGTARHVQIALRLVVLTLARKGEVTAARWDEIDIDAAEWTIPAGRMKARRAHWVPLSRQAVELLRELRTLNGGELLFPHRSHPGKPIADRTLNAVLERLGFAAEAKVHGFRAMASTYLNECGWNPDAIEHALAHREPDPVRRAYNRAGYEGERRRMLQAWADHLDALAAGGNVVPIGRAA